MLISCTTSTASSGGKCVDHAQGPLRGHQHHGQGPGPVEGPLNGLKMTPSR